jgi:RNA polymerase sigma-70 factor (ECF subfamily)
VTAPLGRFRLSKNQFIAVSEVAPLSFDRNADRVYEPARLHDCADEELARLLATGNHDAMSAIFDRYYGLVMRVALKMVRDRGEAEDIAQVTFTDFYKNVKRFDPGKGSLRTWLLQYVYGRSINRLRAMRSRRHFDHMELDDADPSVLATGVGEQFNLGPQEAKLYVQQLLGSLNDKHRRVVELVCFCGLTIPEVAELTGESKGNVQHYYYRSLDRLRAQAAKRQAQLREPRQDPPATPSSQRTGVVQQIRRSVRAVAKEVESVKAHLL